MSEVTDVTAPPDVSELPADTDKDKDTAIDWRAKLTTLTQQQRHMLESGLGADCSFVVCTKDGKKQMFRAHKFVMYRASPVFEAIFLGEMDEARSSEVKVTDVQPDIFKKLLEHTYTDKVTFGSLEEAAGLAVAADKYLLLPLRAASLAYVRDKVDAYFVWRAIQLADMLRDVEVTEVCREVLQQETLKCISSPGFLDATEEGVALLLAQNTTNLTSEMALISAVESWARHQAQGKDIREILEPRLLSKLRFLALTPEQFITGPYLSTWLSNDEKESIRGNMSEPGKVTLPETLCQTATPRGPFIIDKNNIVGPVPFGSFALLRPLVTPSERKLAQIPEPYLPITVNKDIWLLSIELPSQYKTTPHNLNTIPKESSSLNATENFYQEDIEVRLTQDANDPNNRRETVVSFNEQTPYNSKIVIKFPEPMLLRKEQYHHIIVTIYNNGQYPLAPRAAKVKFCDIDFDFSERSTRYRYYAYQDRLISVINFTAVDLHKLYQFP